MNTLISAVLSALVLFDFEDEAVRKKYPGCVEKYAVGGDWSHCVDASHAAEFKLPVHDLTPYDKIVIDVVTAGDSDTDSLFFSFRNGTGGVRESGLPVVGGGYERWELGMGWWPETIRKSDVDAIRFWIPDAKSKTKIYIDNITLITAGEKLPPPPPMYQQLKANAAKESVARITERNRVAHEKAFAGFVADCAAKGQPADSPFLLGEASPMEKILPRGRAVPRALDPKKGLDLALARYEKESVQLMVAPRAQDLRKVRVEPVGFEGLPLSAIECRVMGYVQTFCPPPYKVNAGTNRVAQTAEVGWWPDPILDYLSATDVKGRDIQGFWIRVRCPEDQKAGVYRGTLVVRADGVPAAEVPMAVRVYDFTLPKRAPYPQACTFSPMFNRDLESEERLKRIAGLQADPQTPHNAWRRHEREWGDFLADYYITMDNLYHRDDTTGGQPRFDVLMRLKEQGRLDCFNLGYWQEPKGLSEADKDAWRASTLARIAKCHDRAKELGILDHAYIYGCDEVAAEKFPRIRWAIDELKRAFPGVPLLTTAYDHEFGVGSVLSKMDWFTPLTPKFDLAKVAASRQTGHRVWWYVCCGPGTPHANMFLECPAIEGRVLMGMQSVKYRPDGFLYYELSIWNSERPIASDCAFTDWTARSWTKYNGDGSWTCCGPDGLPLATQRLENYRDGLEDYAYAMELERRLKANPGHALGVRARELLEVRDVKSMTDFPRNPPVVESWRRAMAETIEELAR